MYVVRPGDTLWSIARSIDPTGDERPLVDQLASQLHGTVIYPGEQLELPAAP
jgi:LysM repeat protein